MLTTPKEEFINRHSDYPIVVLHAIWESIESYQTVMVVSSNNIRSQDLMHYVTKFLKENKNPHSPDIIVKTRRLVSFDNGSKIIFALPTASAIRGMRLNTLIYDGPVNSEFFNTANISIVKGGRYILL